MFYEGWRKKRKEEEMIELERPLGKSNAINRELVSLERELSSLKRTGANDSFGLYLYGVVFKEKGNESLARASLVESVNNYPWSWNWSAWSELQSFCTSIEILNSLNLRNHWMKKNFLPSAYQELRMHTESLAKYDYLQGIFTFSNYTQAQTAKSKYSLREFDHYFRKSIFFLPNDSRMWIAMAKFYQTEQLPMLEEAIKCYKRVVNCTDTEGIALNQLAKLHQKLGRNEAAAFYFEKDLERMDAEG